MIRVYYSIQKAGSFGVVPSSINSLEEVQQAIQVARQTVVVTWGDLEIVVLVCDDLTDPEIYEGVNTTKLLAVGMIPGKKSDYVED